MAALVGSCIGVISACWFLALAVEDNDDANAVDDLVDDYDYFFSIEESFFALSDWEVRVLFVLVMT